MQGQGDGTAAAPTVLDPRPDAVITDVRPPITLRLAAGTDAAQIELCTDARCNARVESFRATAGTNVLTRDFASGTYWFRVAGVRVEAGGKEFTGKPGPIQRLTIEVRTVFEGPRFTVEGPLEDRATLEKLEPLAGRIVDFLCAYLAIPKPTERVRLSFYATREGYHVATDRLSGGSATNASGAFAKAGFAYFWWKGRLGRAILDAPGPLERTLAHELTHVVQQQALRKYARQPRWLIEAVADYLADLALDAVYGLPDGTSARSIADRTAAWKAYEEGYLLPVAMLIDADEELWKTKVHVTQALVYAEGYTLLRSLGAGDRIQAFLRAVCAFDSDIELHAMRKLKEMFGAPDKLDAALRRWFEQTNRREWDSSGADLRVLPDGGLSLEAPRGGASTVLQHVPIASTHLALTVERTPETEQFILRVGQSPAKKQGYAVRFWRGGPLEVVRIGEKEQRLVLKTAGPKWERCKIDLEYDDQNLTVSIDGTEQLRVALPPWPASGTAGRIGFGVKDGRVVVRDWALTPPAGP